MEENYSSQTEEKIKTTTTYLVILVVGVLLIVVVAYITILLPGQLRATDQLRLTDCKANFRDLGAALEAYSADNLGRYPPSLSLLTPAYLTVIPQCPVSHTFTYVYQSSASPDIYTIYCSGVNHTSVTGKPDFPRFDSIEGIIE